MNTTSWFKSNLATEFASCKEASHDNAFYVLFWTFIFYQFNAFSKL